MRVTVIKSHAIGQHKPQPYELKEIAKSTLNSWIREFKKKVDRTPGYGIFRDNRDEFGNGKIEFHYYVSGCENVTVFEIEVK